MLSLVKGIKHLEQHATSRDDLRIRLWTRESLNTDLEAQKRYFDNLPDDRVFFEIINDGEYVGTCGLTEINYPHGVAEFSLFVAPWKQGKGYGTEALIALCNYGFDIYGLNTIFGETFCYPKEAKKLLEVNQQRLVPVNSMYKQVNKGGDWYINPAAIVFERVGFEYEGFLRERYLKFGRRVSTVMVGLTRSEWKHSRLHY